MAEAGGTCTRRRFLIGAGTLGAAAATVGVAGELVEHDVLPGRVALHRILGLNGADGEIPQGPTGPVVDGSFRSQHRLGAETAFRLLYPPGHRPGDRLPLLVCLHGASGDHTTITKGLGFDHYLAAATAAGVPPFAIVGVDGGATGYWHERTDGEDSGAMVTDELLPLLGQRGLEVGRPAYLGWSMGGFGVLNLAERVGAQGVRAVVAESPALWRRPGDAPSHAFDGPADFRAHDVFTRLAQLRDIAVRVDCGTGDPFYPVAQQLVAALRPHPDGGFSPGGHNNGYWRRMAPAQFRFVGTQLAA